MINMELLACSMIRIRKAGREIHGAGVLGSFIVGTTPLQSHSSSSDSMSIQSTNIVWVPFHVAFPAHGICLIPKITIDG